MILSLFVYAEGCKNLVPNGAYIWGVHSGIDGLCDHLGGTCLYVSDTYTTCNSTIDCIAIARTMNHVHGVNAAIIQFVL